MVRMTQQNLTAGDYFEPPKPQESHRRHIIMREVQVNNMAQNSNMNIYSISSSKHCALSKHCIKKILEDEHLGV